MVVTQVGRRKNNNKNNQSQQTPSEDTDNK
jgi:hypothetical protein